MDRAKLKGAISEIGSNSDITGTTLMYCARVFNGSLENLEDSINRNAKSNRALSLVIAVSSGVLAIVGIINIVLFYLC